MLKVYSKDACPQCEQAIKMLTAKGIEHQVLKLGTDYTKDVLLALAPNARTVPQVFSDIGLIGGLPELMKYLASA